LRIVVVGYGTAGSAAAGYARRFCRECEIIVVERRRYAVFHPCSIPEAIAGLIPFESLREEKPLTPGVEAVLGKRVVDGGGGFIELEDGGRIEYDRLILATGATPLIPGGLREAVGLSGVYTLRDVEDGVRIREKALSSSKAVVIGGGAVGLEVAVALNMLGLKVSVFEMMPHILPGMLDGDMARMAEALLASRGIEVLTNNPARLVEERGGRLRVVGDKQEREADLVVMAVGVRPDTTLAGRMGVKTGSLGGIMVDKHMETNVSGIYAAGDNAEVRDLVSGNMTLAMLASPAFRQGRAAGINAAGGSAEYKGTVKPWIVNLHDAAVGGAGISLEAAEKIGMDAVAARIQAYNKPQYMPGAERISVKLVASRDKGRILGVEVFSKADITGLVDVAASLIRLGADVWSAVELENAYMPRFSEVYTPLYVAAEAAARRLERDRRR